MFMRANFLSIRRFILKYFVPELIWPKYIFLDRTRIKVRNTPYSFGVKWLLTRRSDDYELAERSFISGLSKGDHVLEFGGSIGVVTALIASQIGPTGRVVSIEASTELAEYSKSWLEKSDNTKVICAYAFPVFKSISMTASFDGSAGSLGGIVSFESINDSSKKIDENHFFLEDAFKIKEFKPKVLFIDIEGSEQIMLDHKPDIPKGINQIVIELHPSIYGKEVNQKIIQVILDEGFVLAERDDSVYQFLRG